MNTQFQPLKLKPESVQNAYLKTTYMQVLSFSTAEAYVGKGYFKKRTIWISRGRAGIKKIPECRLTVVVREITPEEEAEIARLKVSNFLKLTKRERRLVPHKLIETTPIWDRKGKARRSRSLGDMAA